MNTSSAEEKLRRRCSFRNKEKKWEHQRADFNAIDLKDLSSNVASKSELTANYRQEAVIRAIQIVMNNMATENPAFNLAIQPIIKNSRKHNTRNMSHNEPDVLYARSFLKKQPFNS